MEGTTNCVLCKDVFQGLKIKHLCKNCGTVVCGNCSELLVFKQQASTQPMRVCRVCKEDEGLTRQLNVPFASHASKARAGAKEPARGTLRDNSSCADDNQEVKASGNSSAASPVFAPAAATNSSSSSSKSTPTRHRSSSRGYDDVIPSPSTPYSSADSYKGTGKTPFLHRDLSVDADADVSAGEAVSPPNLRASPHASAGTDSIASNMDSPSRGFSRVGNALPPPSTPSHRGADTGRRLSSPSKTLARVSGDHLVGFSVELPREPPLPGATPIVVAATNDDSPNSPAKKHGATFSVIELPEHAKRRGGGGYLWLVVLVVTIISSGLVGSSYFGSSSNGEALANRDQQRVAEQRVAEERAAEQRVAEQRVAKQWAEEQRLAEQERAAGQRAAAEQERQKQEAEAKRSATLEALSAGIPSPDIHLSQQGGSRALRAQWLD